MQILPAVVAMVSLCIRGNGQMTYRYVHLLAKLYETQRGLIWYLPSPAHNFYLHCCQPNSGLIRH
jgi:hypothetical protein